MAPHPRCTRTTRSPIGPIPWLLALLLALTATPRERVVGEAPQRGQPVHLSSVAKPSPKPPPDPPPPRAEPPHIDAGAGHARALRSPARRSLELRPRWGYRPWSVLAGRNRRNGP